jgi:hypothetical protein
MKHAAGGRGPSHNANLPEMPPTASMRNIEFHVSIFVLMEINCIHLFVIYITCRKYWRLRWFLVQCRLMWSSSKGLIELRHCKLTITVKTWSIQIQHELQGFGILSKTCVSFVLLFVQTYLSALMIVLVGHTQKKVVALNRFHKTESYGNRKCHSLKFEVAHKVTWAYSCATAVTWNWAERFPETLVSLITLPYSDMKMETVCFSETLVSSRMSLHGAKSQTAMSSFLSLRKPLISPVCWSSLSYMDETYYMKQISCNWFPQCMTLLRGLSWRCPRASKLKLSSFMAQFFDVDNDNTLSTAKLSHYTQWRRLGGGERRYSSYSFPTSALDRG